MEISALVDRLLKTQRQRHLVCRIDNAKVLGETLLSDGIRGGEGYFTIRLSEMFLKDKREWWIGFNPLAIAIADFNYNQTNQSIPIYIGNQLLKSIKPALEDQYVEYRNTKVIGPIAYNGGDVGLFVGLFRVQVTNYSIQLFNFIESLIGAFDLSHLDPYIAWAGNITKGIAGLFGLKEVQLKIGVRNVYTESGPEDNLFREGYLLMAACQDENTKKEELWVKDGILHVGENERQLKPFQDDDFCLLKIEQSYERTDFHTLQFNSQWEHIINQLYDGNIEEADRLFLSLVKAVAQSPDLIRKQRFRLIQLYKANYEKEIEVFRGIIPQRSLPPTRGGRIAFNAQTVIQKAAYSAHRREYGSDVLKALIDISKNLDGIVGQRRLGKSPNDAEILSQMRTLEKVSTVVDVDPICLANALVADLLDTN